MGRALFRPGSAGRVACLGLLLGAAGLPMAAGQGTQDAADIRLEIQVVSLYAQRVELRSSSLEAFVQDGRVTLSGTLDADSKRQLAVRLAQAVEGIVSVDNRISISSPLAHRPAWSAASSANQARAAADGGWCGAFVELAGPSNDDTWITTKVLLAFVQAGDLKASAIAVSTCNGVVNLNGTVRSEDERTRVVKLALSVAGVRAVRSEALIAALCGGMRGSAPTPWPWVAIVCLPIPRNGARAG